MSIGEWGGLDLDFLCLEGVWEVGQEVPLWAEPMGSLTAASAPSLGARGHASALLKCAF